MEFDDIKKIDFSDALFFQPTPGLVMNRDVDEVDSAVDDRINQRIAHGIKKAMEVLVNSLDRHFQNKMRLLVTDQVKL